MKKLVLTMHVGFCGMDAIEYWEFPDNISQEELDQLAWEQAKDNAAMYGYYPTEEYENEEDNDCYTDAIEGSFEPYDAEVHGYDVVFNKYGH